MGLHKTIKTAGFSSRSDDRTTIGEQERAREGEKARHLYGTRRHTGQEEAERDVRHREYNTIKTAGTAASISHHLQPIARLNGGAYLPNLLVRERYTSSCVGRHGPASKHTENNTTTTPPTHTHRMCTTRTYRTTTTWSRKHFIGARDEHHGRMTSHLPAGKGQQGEHRP